MCLPADVGGALAEARRFRPHVALVGVGHPEDGGTWILRMLQSYTDPVAAVVIAAPTGPGIAEAASRLGAVDCLSWPATHATVLEAVHRAVAWAGEGLNRRQQAQRLRDEIATGYQKLIEIVGRTEPSVAPRVLLAVLEARSPELHDHAQRVARSAVALAHALRLPPPDIQAVRDAALFHEIGKVALPPRLLVRAPPLADEEVDAVRTHLTVAEDVLRRVPSLEPAAPIVVATHERWDGRGYPHGLHGDAIPLGARIVAITDSYDGMTAGRPLSDPFAHDEAMVELVAASGAQFDPDVVRAWMVMGERVRCCS